MVTSIHEPISVLTLYHHATHTVIPKKLQWKERTYHINKLGHHHTVKKGEKLIHIFSVCNETLAFRIAFDTQTLEWMLEEIEDGIG
ncbi:hypothetical protein A3D77_06505 [Candidatus Gottesmanbacteria bacterium RIFCSPHIGHO2_02_FULL_39_11]|uniref:Uncharacterized protein n=1 Tax=Candidatus Gottesmanbacteria bacterium RIFCSPHIGHO2_02_FULL_39_11 TaxID=1798382 RepID=A0A1F5ZTM3_9BACT|nr:MAG: hypothetical protein A3D77_06505 [Candidatus Gottesmanbacteria bacterium RIFCSPHIGHO2_02_FULL_39_11]